MAVSTVLEVSRLDDGDVLAPERYDPRRRYLELGGIRLSDVVSLPREQTSAGTASATQQFLVLATGDARDGIVRPTVPPCNGTAIGSTKKRIRPGHVIVSRLRPYLRQVAWIDGELLESADRQSELLCSSEFYVLQSKDESSIAFLVPFLLMFSRAISLGCVARRWPPPTIQRAYTSVLANTHCASQPTGRVVSKSGTCGSAGAAGVQGYQRKYSSY